MMNIQGPRYTRTNDEIAMGFPKIHEQYQLVVRDGSKLPKGAKPLLHLGIMEVEDGDDAKAYVRAMNQGIPDFENARFEFVKAKDAGVEYRKGPVDDKYSVIVQYPPAPDMTSKGDRDTTRQIGEELVYKIETYNEPKLITGKDVFKNND